MSLKNNFLFWHYFAYFLQKTAKIGIILYILGAIRTENPPTRGFLNINSVILYHAIIDTSSSHRSKSKSKRYSSVRARYYGRTASNSPKPHNAPCPARFGLVERQQSSHIRARPVPTLNVYHQRVPWSSCSRLARLRPWCQRPSHPID